MSSAESFADSTALSIDSFTLSPCLTMFTPAFFASLEFKILPPTAPIIRPAPTFRNFFLS